MVTQRRMENKRLEHKKKSIRNKIIIGVDCDEKTPCCKKNEVQVTCRAGEEQ